MHFSVMVYLDGTVLFAELEFYEWGFWGGVFMSFVCAGCGSHR